MKLYRKVDDNGLFIEDVLLDKIPYLTKEVPDVITNEDGTTTTLETTHTEIVTETVEEDVDTDVWNEELQDYETILVTKEVPVLDPHYIKEPCPEGFYLPKWDGAQWVEGMSQEEIDTINNVIPGQTTEEKLDELATNVNEALYAIMLLSIE